MVPFDTVLWRAKAWKRLEKAISTGRNVDKEERAWFFDVIAIRDIEILTTWVQKRGLKLLFSSKVANGTYEHEPKTIEVCSNLRPVRQAIVILHECGHHLVDSARGHALSDPTCFSERVTLFEDELEAWRRGKKLAQRLNLRVREEELNTYRVDCVRSYMKWALDPKKWT